MKKNLLFLSVIFISVTADAQTSVYHPFADSGAVWRMQWMNACTSGPPCVLTCFSNYQYRIEGDTILSGNNYKKVIKEGYTVSTCSCIMNVPSCSGSTYYSSFYCGIRDDSVNRKAYINDGITPEELFFDFNLTIGDSVHNRFCYQKIVGIDSLLIGSNYRKSYTLEFSGKAVEGIGYVDNNIYDGPFEGCGPCVCNDGWGLMCYRLNGVVLYGDTNCTLVTSVGEIQAANASVELFPNPVTNELRIENLELKIDAVEIYNVLGEKIFSQRPTAGGQKQLSIDVSFLNAGIYFVKVKVRQGTGSQGRGENKEAVIKLLKE